jgi:HAD superfamily hydrolase (TIGR01509 family)
VIGRRAWVFDLDGTLTVAVHDFAAMKRRLGLPVDRNLLDGLHGLGGDARVEAERAIEAWEWAHAERARAAPGVRALLDELRADGARVGIVTRNLRAVALRTLEVAGLADGFAVDDVVGRHEAAPKPAPDGVRALLRRWDVAPADAVFVGDHHHDLRAGRAAGTLTVLLHAAPPADWLDDADHVMPEACALHARWRADRGAR